MGWERERERDFIWCPLSVIPLLSSFLTGSCTIYLFSVLLLPWLLLKIISSRWLCYHMPSFSTFISFAKIQTDTAVFPAAKYPPILPHLSHRPPAPPPHYRPLPTGGINENPQDFVNSPQITLVVVVVVVVLGVIKRNIKYLSLSTNFRDLWS